ncbi:MAG: DUF368 domain-containing protein [Clostridia bacterium]|nr:DUF368 domain-containing protein [Clostridia bacterium]
MENKKGTLPVWAKWLLSVFIGAFIGVGAILPGLSGGVMCVLFGVYQPLMETLSHPFKGIKKHWRLLLPVIIGIAVGFVGFAGILEALNMDGLVQQSIFLGLVLGTLPALWKDAGEEKRTSASFVTLGVSFVLMVLLLAFFGSVSDESTQMAKLIGGIYPETTITVDQNFGWFMVVGVCFALSIVMPGMSFSSPLICLGLFDPLTENLTKLMALDFSVIPNFVLPVALGGLLTVIVFAKPMNALFEKKCSIAYHLVMGAVFASTLLLIPIKFDGFTHGLWCVIGIVGGAIIGYLLDIIQSKIKE